MFSLMILNIVNDTEIFRIVSFSLHSPWPSGSIKHCQITECSVLTQPPGPGQTTCRASEPCQVMSVTDVICHSDYQSCLALLLLTGCPALSPGDNYKELHHTVTIISPDMCSSAPVSVRVCHILRIFPIFQHKAGLP